mgnify:FL=1
MNFTEQFVKEQLSVLGYKDIPTDLLREFVMELNEKIDDILPVPEHSQEPSMVRQPTVQKRVRRVMQTLAFLEATYFIWN